MGTSRLIIQFDPWTYISVTISSFIKFILRWTPECKVKFMLRWTRESKVKLMLKWTRECMTGSQRIDLEKLNNFQNYFFFKLCSRAQKVIKHKCVSVKYTYSLELVQQNGGLYFFDLIPLYAYLFFLYGPLQERGW